METSRTDNHMPLSPTHTQTHTRGPWQVLLCVQMHEGLIPAPIEVFIQMSPQGPQCWSHILSIAFATADLSPYTKRVAGKCLFGNRGCRGGGGVLPPYHPWSPGLQHTCTSSSVAVCSSLETAQTSGSYRVGLSQPLQPCWCTFCESKNQRDADCNHSFALQQLCHRR